MAARKGTKKSSGARKGGRKGGTKKSASKSKGRGGAKKSTKVDDVIWNEPAAILGQVNALRLPVSIEQTAEPKQQGERHDDPQRP